MCCVKYTSFRNTRYRNSVERATKEEEDGLCEIEIYKKMTADRLKWKSRKPVAIYTNE